MRDRLENLKEAMEALARDCLGTAAKKVDLVSRNEFEVQVKTLDDAKNKLERLSDRVKKLESLLNSKSS